jgi:hypothetical protein
MAMHNPLHDGQADARAFIVFDAMQSLKNTKQLVRVAHVETNSVVFDKVGHAVHLCATAHFNARSAALAGVLYGVAEQIQPDLLK